jgi:hypothetical protein
VLDFDESEPLFDDESPDDESLVDELFSLDEDELESVAFLPLRA